jgi:hypothetical protein
MTAADPDRILAEFAELRVADPDPELAAVRMAMVVEDVFGVTLSDEQIDAAVLGDPTAVRRLLAASAGPR